jgi:hypothetical protein
VSTPTITPAQMGDAADAALVGEVVEAASPWIELGTTGLKRTSGYLDEEFLPALRGRKGVQVYREMGDNDAITGATLFAIIQLLRNVDWPVIPPGKGKEAAEATKYVESLKDDMSHSWDDFIVECLSHLQYGWAWHEMVLKRRVSPWQRDGRLRSQHTDGLWGIRKLPIRAQETLQRWVFDDDGDVIGMIQLAPPDYQIRTIPIQRSLLFRYGAHKGSPEGRSILRNSYRSWFYKKRLEEFEAVGVERDLAGLPMVTVPSDYLRAAKGSDQGKMVEAMRKMVRSVRRNEQEGIVFPAAFDPDTKQPLFKFELLGSGGARQFSTNELIQRYEQRQLMTILADWIMVGHDSSTGTYNLHVDKTGIFRAGVNSITAGIADVLNRHLIPRLFALNGWRMAELPKFQPGDVDAPDLLQLTQFLTGTAQLGFNWGPNAEMERYLRHAAGLPELGEDDYAKRRQLARKTESIQMMQTQTEYLAARSQLAQQQAQQQMLAAGEMLPEDAQQIGATQDQRDQQDQQAAQQQQDAQNQQQQQGMQMASQAVDLGIKMKQAGQPQGSSARTSGKAQRPVPRGGSSGNRPRGAPGRGRK